MKTFLNRLLLKLNRKLNPSLDRVLSSAGGTVERLADRMEYYREQAREYRRDIAERAEGLRSEITEAIALSRDPWGQSDVREAATPATRELMSLRESIPLRETIYGMAELEIALEDRGWKRMLAFSTYEFSRYGIQSIILISRLYSLKNPLIRRGIQVSAFYPFGRGMDVSSPDEAADEVIGAFFSDPRNASQLSHAAFVKHEETLWTDGNLFWAFFTDPADGSTLIRNVDALEICDIVTDPNDSSVAWYFHRQWMETTLNEQGRRDSVARDAWYYAVGWEDIPGFIELDELEGKPVERDKSGLPIPMMHCKVGYLPKWRFGCPACYAALDYARAYLDIVQNYCTTLKALTRIALVAETKGGAPAIAALKQTLATTFMQDLSTLEMNPPPVTGAAFVTDPSQKITPFKSSGMVFDLENARQVKMQICAAFGLGEHFFGDINTGNLATASSLDRPTELMFLERQEYWRDVVQSWCRYVLKQSVVKPKGRLREAICKRRNIKPSDFKPESVLIETAPIRKRTSGEMVKIYEAKKPAENKSDAITISVSFPAIVEGDMGLRVKAIVEALTLNGYAPIGIDERVGIEMLLSELGYEDAHELVMEMFPESEYEVNRMVEPEPEDQPIAAPPVNGVPAPALNGAPEGTSGNPTKQPSDRANKLTPRESAMLRTLVQLRKVIKFHEAKQS